MNREHVFPMTLLALALLTVTPPAAAELGLQRRGTPFTAPNRSFSVMIPPSWGAALVQGDPNTIQFRQSHLPGHGTLYIRRIKVPAGAHPRQLMLNALESRLRKMPGFRVTSRRDVQVAGHPAASVVGAYDFQGNAQYPRTLEEIYVVTGTDAYVFHFECAEPSARSYAHDLTMFYTSFQPRVASMRQSPFAAENEGEVDDSELPF